MSDQANVFAPASRPEEREQAAARQAAFRFRFPVDHRRFGGKFTVTENAKRLQRFFYFERRLFQGLGSWTLAIPDFEVKLETGRHIFWHADAAHRLRTRLTEQEQRLVAIDGFRDADIDRFIEEVLSAADAPELLVGIHLVAGQALATAYRHHIDDTCPIADAPTVRVLRGILSDYEPMLTWAQAAVDAYVAGGVESCRLESWRWHLNQLLASIGGVTGADARTSPPAALRSVAKPYVRNQHPKRDGRFATFHHTGDYDAADGTPRFTDKYQGERLHFIRTQRDEVDAIEAFGTFIWDIRFKDFDAEYNLARITWDEARHTEMGHRVMQIFGYDPYELPNRLTPSTCRGPMADQPEIAMSEINLFGEVGVMKMINGFIDQARERNDNVLVHTADFVRSDERTHVRKGQMILKAMTSMDMLTLERKTREVFTECLVNLGAMKRGEPGFVLSREEIERLIGE
jgi:hypothetical protein